MRIRSVPTSRHAFAVTALLLAAACGRATEATPTAPPAAAEPAPSAAAPPPPAEAAAPAATPAPAAPSSLREEEADEKPRDDTLARPSERDELAQAVAELERSRAELDGAFARQKARPSSSAPSAGASRSADANEAPAPKAEKKSAESSCSTACRAFSSLGRAASAVCRLAGEKDSRCTHAHQVLADAEKRVAVCGCS